MVTKKTLAGTIVVVVLLFLSGFTESVTAQDIITLKTGKELKVDITEESQDVIKYREFGNSSGPLYTISKEKVASVKYSKKSGKVKEQTGEKEKLTPKDNEVSVVTSQLLTVKKRYVYMDGKVQSPRQVKTLMEDYPDAMDLFSRGHKLCNASNGCAIAILGTCFAASLVSNGMKADEGKKIIAGALGISGGLIITGIVLASKGKQKIRNAVSIYNTGISKPVSYQLNFRISTHGAGVILRF
jgi:hypothetical protein